MADVKTSTKPLVLRAKNKEELLRKLEDLIKDEGKAALMGHIEHLVCEEGKTVQCHLPSDTTKFEIPTSATSEDPTMTGVKSEVEECNSNFSYDSFLAPTNGSRTFEGFMYAALKWASVVGDVTVDDLQGYLAHLSYICLMAVSQKYDSQVHVDYDKAIRNQADQLGWPVFKAVDIDITQLHYGGGDPPMKEHWPPIEESDVPLSVAEDIVITDLPDNEMEYAEEAQVESEVKDTTQEPEHHQEDEPIDLDNGDVDGGEVIDQQMADDLTMIQEREQSFKDNADADGGEVYNQQMSNDISMIQESDKSFEGAVSGSESGDTGVLRRSKRSAKRKDFGPDFDFKRESAKDQKSPRNSGERSVPGKDKDKESNKKASDITTVKQEHSTSDKTKSELDDQSRVQIEPRRKMTRSQNRGIPVKDKHPQWQTFESVSTDPVLLEYSTEKKESAEVAEDNEMAKPTQAVEVTVVARAKQNVIINDDGEKLHVCSICRQMFKARHELIEHRKIHSGKNCVCPECGRHFGHTQTLLRHMMRHEADKPHKCMLCDKSFIRPSDLKGHLKTHTGEKPHLCSKCGKAYKTSFALRNHVTFSHTNERPFKCDQCGKGYADKGTLTKHLRIHSAPNSFICSQCGRGFSTQEYLIKHTKNRHERIKPEKPPKVRQKRTYSCTYCDKEYGRFRSLKSHLVIHEGGELSCSHCDKTFNEERKLKLHEMTHSDEKPYACSECDKAFRDPYTLKKHMYTHTGEKPYKCSECSEQFFTAQLLNIHKLYHKGETPFKCPVCNKEFLTAELLNSHSAKHSKEKSYLCTQCGLKYSCAQYLKRHVKRQHESGKEKELFFCSICTRKFKTSETHERHMAKHRGEKLYACTICDHRLADPQTLKKHILTHTGEKTYQCQHCDKSFLRSTGLKSHMMTHTQEKPHLCSDCGKGFRSVPQLRRHVRFNHTNERPHRCEICGKGYVDSGTLRKHMVIHSDADAFQCVHCGRGFKTAEYLTKHTKNVHEKIHEVHECPTCTKQFRSVEAVNKHILTVHSEDRPHACSTCGQQFALLEALEQHMTTHTGEKPFVCGNCGKAFRKLNVLQVHMRTHTGEKPYSCMFCSKRFAQASYLKLHQMTHTGERPYKCSVCNKGFLKASFLRNHMPVHTGNRPYKCAECDKSFSTAPQFRLHMAQKHTGSRPYECNLCDKGFSCMAYLTSHMKHSHGIIKIKTPALPPKITVAQDTNAPVENTLTQQVILEIPAGVEVQEEYIVQIDS